MTLGSMIQKKRKEIGLSQEKLAESIGKTAGYIGQLERGESNPSYFTLKELIRILNLDARLVFAETDYSEQNSTLKDECDQMLLRFSPKQQEVALEALKLISKYGS